MGVSLGFSSARKIRGVKWAVVTYNWIFEPTW